VTSADVRLPAIRGGLLPAPVGVMGFAKKATGWRIASSGRSPEKPRALEIACKARPWQTALQAPLHDIGTNLVHA